MDGLFFLAEMADETMVVAILEAADKDDILVMFGALDVRLTHSYKYFKVFKFFVRNGSYSPFWKQS